MIFVLLFSLLSLSLSFELRINSIYTLSCVMVKIAFNSQLATASQPASLSVFFFIFAFSFVFYWTQVWIFDAMKRSEEEEGKSPHQSMAERRSILIYLWLIYLFIEYWDLFFLFSPLSVKYTNTHVKWEGKKNGNTKHRLPINRKLAITRFEATNPSTEICNILVEIAATESHGYSWIYRKCQSKSKNVWLLKKTMVALSDNNFKMAMR